MKTIITTVGTSLFTNYKEKVRKEGRDDLISNYLDNLEPHDASSYNKFLNTDIAEIKYVLMEVEKDWLEKPSSSAEMQSIDKFIEENKDNVSAEKISVYLLSTDTIQSRLAAEIICKVLNEKYSGMAIFEPEYGKGIIEGLTVEPKENDKNNPNFFDKGLMNLVERAKQLIDLAKEEKREVVLNISGGYKGIIPVMTIIGQLEGVPLIYQYEKSNSLVNIGGLPVNFDMSLVYSFYPFYTDREEIEVTNANKQILADLDKKYGLFRPVKDAATNQVKFYKRTVIGRLLNSYAFAKAPESLKVLGILVEYRLYEHYNKLGKYHSVEREAKVLGKTRRDFDIVLNQGEILIESKSADQVYKNSVAEQIIKQFEELKELNAFPKEFIIYFYFIGKIYSETYFEVIKDNLKKLREDIREFTNGQTVLTAQYTEFGLNLLKEKVSDNPYKSLAQQKLSITPVSLD